MEHKDIRLKHKIQLRKKVEDPVSNPMHGRGDDGNSRKSRNWIRWIGWIVVVFIVLCLIGFWIFSKSGENVGQEVTEDETYGQVVATLPDSVTEDMTAVKSSKDEAPPIGGGHVDSTSDIQDQPTASSDVANVTATTSSAESDISDDVEAEAMKVIRGDYGVGQERKDRLGAKYQTIQNRVNELKREGVF